MQVKEFEAYTLKECLQLVRDALGPDAVILETRKFRKGGLLGWGARDAVCIVAATGITVQDDFSFSRNGSRNAASSSAPANGGAARSPAQNGSDQAVVNASRALPTEAVVSAPAVNPAPAPAGIGSARHLYARSAAAQTTPRPTNGAVALEERESRPAAAETPRQERSAPPVQERKQETETRAPATAAATRLDMERLASLERTMREIRDTLNALQQQHQETEERTVSAVVSAVTPAVVSAIVPAVASAVPAAPSRVVETAFPGLYDRMIQRGVSEALAHDLIDSLPDFKEWSEEARLPLAETALREIIAHRLPEGGAIRLTLGRLKAVALIGPTGVGKTTTIAKLAAHFALLENRKVALLTVDTYRIAAVEQLKIYSQIIDIPIAVAYSKEDVVKAVDQFKSYDLLLIDTAGRSQNNIMQIGELKTLLEDVQCETHLVLSAPIKESDMLVAAERFAAARLDRMIFTKLDETSTYGSLLNVADRTGLPLSYLTNGQKVPEDLMVAEPGPLADLILR